MKFNTGRENYNIITVIGVDFAGPIKYRIRAKTEGKAYLALYACSLTRGLFLEVLPNLATSEFLRSLKRLIARRGRPKKIYSDNGKTFVGAEKWLKQVMRDEKTQDYLAREKKETSRQSKLAAENWPVSLIRPFYVMRSNRERIVHVKVGCLRVWFHRYFFIQMRRDFLHLPEGS